MTTRRVELVATDRSVLEPWACRLAATSTSVDLEDLTRLAHRMDAAPRGTVAGHDSGGPENRRVGQPRKSGNPVLPHPQRFRRWGASQSRSVVR